jgi:hypothetical protein
MKKILVTLAGLAAIISCIKEKPMEDRAPGGAITVTVEALAQEAAPEEREPVKTYLGTYQGQDNTVLWGMDEQMQLAVTAGGSTVFAASESTSAYNGQASAQFSFTVNPATASSYLYQGFYPASAVAEEGNTDPASYRVRLPLVQNASAGKYDPKAYLMIARPTPFDSKSTTWTAAFRRAVALNCLSIENFTDEETIKKVEIIAPAGVYLSGERAMDLSTGESGEILEGFRNIDVKYASPLGKEEGNFKVWFTSWGAAMTAGQSLRITLYTDSYYYTRNVVIPSGRSITLEEGKLNTIRVDFSNYDDADDYVFSGGKGTADNPYRIETVADLVFLASKVNAGTGTYASASYLQTADIDFAGATLQAIGNTNASGAQRFFKGSYDGNGFKVRNVSVANALNTATSAGSNKAFGFFGYLAENAHVNRLYLENPKVQAQTTYNIGAIAGNIEGASSVIIENCTVTGATVSEGGSSGWHVGGLVGQQMSGVIRNCSFSGTVRNTQNNKVGGLVGHMSGGTISGCRVTGVSTEIEAANDYVGGIVGIADGTSGTKTIENCVVNCASITATKGFVGGVLGQLGGGEMIINRCTVIADVINNAASQSGDTKYGNLGGIVGYVAASGYKVVIANCCYAGGELCNYNGKGGSVAGILGGGNSSASGQKYIVNCTAFPSKILTGDTTRNLGGIAGWIKYWTIRNCYSPVPHTAIYFNGAQISSAESSCGSIYGWYSSYGEVQDSYWLSTFQVGKGTASPNNNQGISDAQMRNGGSVTRPSTGVSYSNFIAALNADAADWNENPVLDVYAQSWELYDNGYPTPKGISNAISGGGESPSGMNLLNLCNDKISEYGHAEVPANHIYLVAHRGLTYWARQNNYPENCVPTIQKAIELGADMVEVDVRTTSDGKLVVLHDESVRPVTNCGLSGSNAYVQNMTLSTLQGYRMRNRDGSNYPMVNGQYIHVPTLEEVLNVTKDRIYVTIHIKEADMDKVIDAIKNTGTVDQVAIFGASDKKAYVARALEVIGSKLAIEPWLDVADDVTTYQPSYFGCCKLFQYDALTYYNETITGLGKQVHERGALSFSNALNEDKNGVDWETPLINWYGSQSGSCVPLDKFIASGSDFLQIDFLEIADAYFKKKGLR